MDDRPHVVRDERQAKPFDNSVEPSPQPIACVSCLHGSICAPYLLYAEVPCGAGQRIS